MEVLAPRLRLPIIQIFFRGSCLIDLAISYILLYDIFALNIAQHI